MTIRVLGIIPARGGSKGIPRKNITMLAGKPLIAWTIEAARASCLERIILSSDDPEIIQVAQETGGVEIPFVRPDALATDTTPGIEVVLHAVEWLLHHEAYQPDAVMLLQPTSPLRHTEHINEAVRQFVQREADSLVSVVRASHHMIPESLMRLNQEGWLEAVVPFDERQNLRQSKPTYYARNGAAIYLVKTDLLLEKRTLYGSRLVAYAMSREDSLDIDDAFDLRMCEWVLKSRG
ncbi:MAG: acylneuraminate cytidylyltransferase family protein [Chloroflexaceae bacterium]|nr:acylneuraminate cytidylyltransferase family protein [Chloroflexaceae bacterium]